MQKEIKILSWNVNGIRAAIRKGFLDFVEKEQPDILCLQETKAQVGQVEVDLAEYEEFWHSAEKKGYSGTAIFTKIKPTSVVTGIPEAFSKGKLGDQYGGENDNEGRVMVADFNTFYLATVYTPNSKRDLSRLEYRHKTWDPIFLEYMKALEKEKPVIFCGDLNVAHKEIDLARPDDNHKNAGFTDQEREGFDNIVNAGFIDTFREFNTEGGSYTWWSNFAKSRERNVGWRIDYFCVSKSVKNNVVEAFTMPEVMGSDHCPVGIIYKV